MARKPFIANQMRSNFLRRLGHTGRRVARPGSVHPLVESVEQLTPVLLPDLVAGWALTSGPQQTLDSTGVIASGPLDLTNQNGVTFGAFGATFISASQQALWHADDVLLRQGDYPYTISFEVVINGNIANTQDFVAKAANLVEYQIAHGSGGGQSWIVYAVGYDDSSQTGAYNLYDVTPTEAGVRYVVIAWHDPSAGFDYLSDNDVLGYPDACKTGHVNTDPFSYFAIGTTDLVLGRFADATIRRVRRWNRALTASEQTWLVNGGAGRTDAEVAAYTG